MVGWRGKQIMMSKSFLRCALQTMLPDLRTVPGLLHWGSFHFYQLFYLNSRIAAFFSPLLQNSILLTFLSLASAPKQAHSFI